MADVKELNINNTTYDIKAKSVVDTNSGAVKMWTGTKAQYDAIVTKDATTLYFLTDVGKIYLGDTLVSDVADLSGKQDVSNLVTSISSSSTDAQYPSAKCMYDIVGDIETALNTINSGV